MVKFNERGESLSRCSVDDGLIFAIAVSFGGFEGTFEYAYTYSVVLKCVKMFLNFVVVGEELTKGGVFTRVIDPFSELSRSHRGEDSERGMWLVRVLSSDDSRESGHFIMIWVFVVVVVGDWFVGVIPNVSSFVFIVYRVVRTLGNVHVRLRSLPFGLLCRLVSACSLLVVLRRCF